NIDSYPSIRCYQNDIQIKQSYPALGNSGSPIISGLTGNVIGVALSADSPYTAKTVGFLKMKWSGN
ncbi:MAG: ABC-type sulfate transport system substrate-binding protein, partial [Lentimonas sp.]